MSANERQVGGSHYRGEYQHWDFVNDARLGYHSGNATKYIARWRKKNGVQDLKKALHYIDKCGEMQLALENKSRAEPGSLTQVIQGEARRGYLMLELDVSMAVLNFGKANYLTAAEVHAIGMVVLRQWDEARRAVVDMINEAPEDAEKPSPTATFFGKKPGDEGYEEAKARFFAEYVDPVYTRPITADA